MKESIGNTLILNIVIVFVIVFIGLFVTSITYSKGYKVKNRMIEVIEKIYPTCSNNGDDCNDTMMEKINDELSNIGYRMTRDSSGVRLRCREKLGVNDLDSNKFDVKVTYSKKYQVCFARVSSKGRDNNNQYVYYVVNAYMYLDLPIIGDRLQIPVRGETKTFVPGLTS